MRKKVNDNTIRRAATIAAASSIYLLAMVLHDSAVMPETVWRLCVLVLSLCASWGHLSRAPALLQSMANDGLTTLLSPFCGALPSGLACFVLCGSFISLGSLEAVSPFITTSFLGCSLVVHLACLTGEFLNDYFWRPRIGGYLSYLCGVATCGSGGTSMRLERSKSRSVNATSRSTEKPAHTVRHTAVSEAVGTWHVRCARAPPIPRPSQCCLVVPRPGALNACVCVTAMRRRLRACVCMRVASSRLTSPGSP